MQTTLIITPARFLTEEERAVLRARCRQEGVSAGSLMAGIVRRALASGSTPAPAPHHHEPS